MSQKHSAHGFTLEEVRAIYDRPLLPLLDEARRVHLQHHAENDIELCTLISVKTGGCSEDCAYCPQSNHYETKVDAEKVLDLEDVIAAARRAKEIGSTRFCMGVAWREVKDGPTFDRILAMVRGVKELGLETCVTAGMLTELQAARLKDAGLDVYNHNLDTSRENYHSIITTRSYDDRLRTLESLHKVGIRVCSGGIIGMGESVDDRCEMLRTLANLDPPPDSVPVNALVPVEGTPLANMPPIDPIHLVRMIAVARILIPHARIRLSAGRRSLSREAQLMCMLAGANSIFFGDKLLTTPNPEQNDDLELFRAAGLNAMISHSNSKAAAE
ncbi:MAG: biotin synthase BioB [Polyangiaceae bacterium]|nr:biotin synthase BioB [Polyangiaceae bacterium]